MCLHYMHFFNVCYLMAGHGCIFYATHIYWYNLKLVRFCEHHFLPNYQFKYTTIIVYNCGYFPVTWNTQHSRIRMHRFSFWTCRMSFRHEHNFWSFVSFRNVFANFSISYGYMDLWSRWLFKSQLFHHSIFGHGPKRCLAKEKPMPNSKYAIYWKMF